MAARRRADSFPPAPPSESEVGAEVGRARVSWDRYRHLLADMAASASQDGLRIVGAVRALVDARRMLRRTVRKVCGFDLERGRFLPGARTAPENRAAVEQYFSVLYWYWSATLVRVRIEAAAASDRGDDSLAAMARALATANETFPMLLAVAIHRPELGPLRGLGADFALSGWAAAHTNLSLNRRLRAGLMEASERPDFVSPGRLRERLHESLPAEVIRAVAEREAGESLLRGRNALLHRITRGLERRQPPAATLRADPPAPPPAEDFAAREEARIAVARIAPQAGLSPREAEVFALRLERRPLREIAEKLGVSLGTVKTTAYRARVKVEKLKAARPA